MSGKENAGMTSEATLATKYVVGFAYPVLAVFSLGAFLWHLWYYMLRGWFGGQRERAKLRTAIRL